MTRIIDVFKTRKALITFITAGDPSLSVTEKLIYALERSGADIVELGIPFSDPLADGPVIQASHQRALQNNVSLADVFKLVAKARKRTDIPICFMLSYNLVLNYGEDRFYADCERVGVEGIIATDLPPEETKHKHIMLIAPTSTEDRIKLSAAKASGFIYLISSMGITGKRKELASNLAGLVAKIRKYTKLPIAIGFGISTPVQAAEAARIADGVIVGSAIVDLIAKRKTGSVPQFVASLRKGIDLSPHQNG